MENIFHEKQEGYLCAQHCLNALLQGPYFNAVDLANFGHQMDEEERIRMAESGIDSEEYRLFLEQPSGNMDDSGYFSVQVISSALKVWGLELITYNSTESTALVAQNDPSQMKAYICNYKGHWFTIRKIGNQWFNLNSMLQGPQLISDTYLAMYLVQLLQEGYSIFIVVGTLPPCPADEALLLNPIVVPPRSKNKAEETKPESKGYRLGGKEDVDAESSRVRDILTEFDIPGLSSTIASRPTDIPAIKNKVSLGTTKVSDKKAPRERIIPIEIEGQDGNENNKQQAEEDDEDESIQLQKALQLSLQDPEEDIDKSIKLRLDLHADNKTNGAMEDNDEDDELRRALQLSLECVTTPSTPDPEDLRWRRLKYLGVYPRTTNNETSPKLNS